MINVPGIGSGLDINSLVSGLVSAEGDAKTLLLTNRRSDIEFEVSAFGALKSTLSTLTSSLTFLKSSANFQSTTLTSADPEIFTASSTGGSIAPGVFGIEVRELAEAQKLITSGFTDQDTAVGTGTLTISVGDNDFTVTIDDDNNTLAGIRAAINDASDNTGVSATIVNVDDGAGDTEAKLILSADNTGTENALTVTVDDGDADDVDASGLSAFYYDTADATTPERLTQINAALDAEVYIDGQKVVSSSNTVTDAISGVTITALKKDSGTVHDLTVETDTETIKSNIESFVTNYNTLRTFINDVTEFDPNTGDASVLLGDATTRNLSNQIRKQISDTVTGIKGQFTTLVSLGITSNSDATLTIDTSKLDSALNTDMDAVAELFSSENGVATKLDNIINEYTTANGLLDEKISGLNDSVTSINEDIVDLEESLQALEDRLFAQFTALDLLVESLNSTSSFLDQQFDILKNINEPR